MKPRDWKSVAVAIGFATVAILYAYAKKPTPIVTPTIKYVPTMIPIPQQAEGHR
jgi:hypothetical protein